MNVTCPECATTYRVDPLKVPAGGVRARCAKCPAEFLVSVDSAVPAFASEIAAARESGSPPVGESAYAQGSETHPAYEDPPAYSGGADEVAATHEASDPDDSVDTFADSFSDSYAEADEEVTETVGMGNSDLSVGRVAVYFDTVEETVDAEEATDAAEGATATAEEEAAAGEVPDSDDRVAVEDDDAGEIGISVSVDGVTSWDVVEPAEAAVIEGTEEESSSSTEPESDEASADWAARATEEDTPEPTEADPDPDSGFDSSSVFTRDTFAQGDTFAQETPAGAEEYSPNGSGHSDADGYQAEGQDGGHDAHAQTEENAVASEEGDVEEGADEDTSATSEGFGGWEGSGQPAARPVAEEYEGAATLEEVEAPVGFAAVQQPRSDADLALPPAPFGSADPNDRAKSLARALVSDIVVYHRDRRDRSIRAGTLRQEFREEIRKSWDEYVSHVGNQVARDTSYFRDALNDVLAGGQQLF